MQMKNSPLALMQILWVTSALPPIPLQQARNRKAEVILQPALPLCPLCLLPVLFCFLFFSSPPLTSDPSIFPYPSLLFAEHKEGADWRKAVPSYTQSSSTMDFRTWSSLPRDDSLEPLPLNWEMAYTETGMVYFIEWVKDANPTSRCDRWAWKEWVRQLINGLINFFWAID